MRDDSGWRTIHRLYSTVEHFAPTADRPEGISGILAIDPDSGDWQLVAERTGISGPRLARGRRTLAFLERKPQPDPTLWILEYPWDSAPRQVARLSRYATFLWSSSTGDAFFVKLRSPVAGRADRGGVWRINTDGSDWMRLPLSSDQQLHDCSPDGQWLLVSCRGHAGIRMIRPDGTDSRDLTGPEEGCIRPRFSPDGRRIAYASYTQDGESLWVMDINRQGRRLLVLESPMTIVPCWSPDGSRLALKLCDCERGPEGWMIMPKDPSRWRARIEMIDADGGHRRPLVPSPGRILLGDWG